MPPFDDSTEADIPLVCFLSDFKPQEIQVSWLKNDVKLASGLTKFNVLRGDNELFSGTIKLNVSRKSWNDGDRYTCEVTMNGQIFKHNISKSSDKIINPRSPDILIAFVSSNMTTGTIQLLCIISNYWPNNISLVWLKNGHKLNNKDTEFTSMKQENGMYSGNSLLNVPIESWNKDTYLCHVTHQNKNFTQGVEKPQEKIINPRSPDILTASGSSNMTTGTIPLLCIISNYWPNNISLVWLKNGHKLDNKDTGFTSMKQENGMYSGNSLLNVPMESWNKDTYLCHVTHQNKNFTQGIEKPQDGYLPTCIPNVYEDDGGEELQELEEINNMWTTTSTFIVLFLVTLIYSSCVTFVKVK